MVVEFSISFKTLYIQLFTIGKNHKSDLNAGKTCRTTMAKEANMLYRNYFMLLRKDDPFGLELNKA